MANERRVTTWNIGSRHYMHWAVEQSLRRLSTDYIDLYQYHRPDHITPIEETLDALNDLVRAGKVRYVGCSNFEGWRIADADWTARSRGTSRFVSAQNGWSLMSREIETDVIPACERFGLGMLPYSPLMSGMLTGKYKRGQEHPQGSRLALFKEAGTNPGVLKATDRHWPFRAPEFERRLTKAAAVETWRLSAEELDEVGAVGRGEPA